MSRNISTRFYQCFFFSLASIGNQLAVAQSIVDRVAENEAQIAELKQNYVSLHEQFKALTDSLGKSLIVSNPSYLNKSKIGSFPVKEVHHNSLLATEPGKAEVKVPYDGTYLASTKYQMCNAKTYVYAYVYHNKKSVALSYNKANACGTSAALAVVDARKGDTISGQCRNLLTNSKGVCSMSIIYIGSNPL